MLSQEQTLVHACPSILCEPGLLACLLPVSRICFFFSNCCVGIMAEWKASQKLAWVRLDLKIYLVNE